MLLSHSLLRFRNITCGVLVAASSASCGAVGVEDAARNGVSPAPGETVIAGGDRIAWIGQRRVEGGDTVMRFAYCRAGRSARLVFRPLRMGSVTGRAAAAAVRGVNLHVFFSDGSHLRLAPPGSPLATIRSSLRASEVSLPGGTVPVGLAADPANETLYAVVHASVAVSPVDPAPGGGDSTDFPANQAGDGFVLARYDRGVWVRDRALPPDVSGRNLPLHLLVRNGAVHIVHNSGSQDGVIYHRVCGAADGSWSKPAPIPLAIGAAVAGVAWVDGAVVLLVVEGHAQAHRLRALRRSASGWESLPLLRDVGGEPFAFSSVASVGMMGPRALVATVSDEGDVWVGSWSATTGELIDAPKPLSALASQPAPSAHPVIRTVLPYLMLALILGFVFVSRRDTGLFRVSLEPDQMAAGLQPRFVALVVDVLATSPVWAALVYAMLRTAAPEMSPMEQLADAPPSMIWSPAIVGAVLGLYGASFELAQRRTPGKRLMGLSVVAEGGGRCSARAILVRNLFRVVEFHFAAVAILVLLTPSRQRLGDVVARTLVVQRVAIPPTSGGQGPGADRPGEGIDGT